MTVARRAALGVCAVALGAALVSSPLQRSLEGGGVAGAASSVSAASSGRSGPATVHLAVARSQGLEVGVTLRVSVTRPRGALAYAVAFGDGTTSSPPSPQVCAATARPAASRTWRFHHRYRHPGTYKVVATGWAVCTAGRARASLEVTAG